MARGSRQTYAGRRAASRAADAAQKLPVNSVAPAITGTPTEGETLTCSNGTWSNTPDAYSYQWNRSGSAIVDATSSTYDLVADDITCTVKATNLGVSAVATSAATDVIASGGGELPEAPEGFAYVVNGSGEYVTNGDGAYVIAET